MCTELGLRLTGSEPNTAMYCFWRASFRDHGFAERNMKNHMFMMKHRKTVLPHDGFVRFFPQSLKTRQLAGSSGGTNASPMNFAWSLWENFSDMPDDEHISRHIFSLHTAVYIYADIHSAMFARVITWIFSGIFPNIDPDIKIWPILWHATLQFHAAHTDIFSVKFARSRQLYVAHKPKVAGITSWRMWHLLWRTSTFSLSTCWFSIKKWSCFWHFFHDFWFSLGKG